MNSKSMQSRIQRTVCTLAFAVLAAGHVQAQSVGANASAAEGAAAAGGTTKTTVLSQPLPPLPTFKGDIIRKEYEGLSAESSAPASSIKIGPAPTFEGDVIRTTSEVIALQPRFQIAFIDAPVVTWVAAPSQVTVQPGDRLLLEITDAREHLVHWTGALEVDMGNHVSHAQAVAGTPGIQLVEAELISPQGVSLGVARLAIQVASPSSGPALPKASAGLLTTLLPQVNGKCATTVHQIVPGITATSIALIEVCNTGSKPTSFAILIDTSAPAGKTWSVSHPDPTPLLAPGDCITVLVAFALLDTDASGDPQTGHATLSVSAQALKGVLDVFGPALAPTCSAKVLDIDYAAKSH